MNVRSQLAIHPLESQSLKCFKEDVFLCLIVISIKCWWPGSLAAEIQQPKRGERAWIYKIFSTLQPLQISGISEACFYIPFSLISPMLLFPFSHIITAGFPKHDTHCKLRRHFHFSRLKSGYEFLKLLWKWVLSKKANSWIRNFTGPIGMHFKTRQFKNVTFLLS